MSWWSGSHKLIPGAQGDIDAIQDLINRARGYDVGLGKAGKIGKSVLKAFESGKTETNPIIQSYLNAVRNRIAVGNRELERRAAMGVNATATGQQRGLVNAQQNAARLRNEEAGQITIGEMMPRISEQAAGIYGGARSERMGGEQRMMGLEADLLDRINAIRRASTYKTGGLKGTLGDIAGIAGSIAGLPGVGTWISGLGKGTKTGAYSGPGTPWVTSGGGYG